MLSLAVQAKAAEKAALLEAARRRESNVEAARAKVCARDWVSAVGVATVTTLCVKTTGLLQAGMKAM